jgi:spermidine synthase
MPLLFSVTLFLSAALLFFVELMFGRMILPKFGGTPAVWNTCMVFYQAAMLAGYSYAHWMPKWFGVRKQAAIHLGLLLLPFLSLPIAATVDPPGDGNPVLWLLLLLCISVGIPFFMISTSAPLLQKWFASTGHPSARDPYFLYAASNLGSMLALFAYPTVVEHVLELGLRAQSLCWTAGYVGLLGLTGACAYALWKAPEPKEDRRYRPPPSDLVTTPPTTGRVVRWVALAFVPSSMMLGVTMYLSTDISPMPLIWVLPLGLYLLSFILVFSRMPRFIHTILVLTLPVLILLQAYLMLSETSQSKIVLILLHLATLFCACMVCHGELAQDRPDPQYLTAYYLWMSVGGVFGGMFNALVAPVVFKTAAEYPLAMALACLMMPQLDLDKPLGGRWKQVVLPLILGMLGAAFVLNVPEQFRVLAREEATASSDYLRVSCILVIYALMLAVAVWVTLKHLQNQSTSERFFTVFCSLLVVGMVLGGAVQVLASMGPPDEHVGMQVLKWWLEYPLAMAFLCLFLPETAWENRRGLTYLLDVGVACFFALVVAQHLVLLGKYQNFGEGVEWMSEVMQSFLSGMYEHLPLFSKRLHLPHYAPGWTSLSTILQFGPPILLCYAWVTRPIRFGLGVAAILLASAFYNIYYDDTVVLRDRSFFGVLKLERSWAKADDGTKVYYNRLVHGTTLHGKQELDEVPGAPPPLNKQPKHDAEPLTYYHRTGPIGQVFAILDETAENRSRPIAAIGLGTGTVACYAQPGQEFTFYEIDEKVKNIAEDANYFTNLGDARERGAEVGIVLGDARLQMKGAPDDHYRLIVVDAFSSDAIPVHLITYEALELYVKKLAPDGIIAFHISNRYLDLEPVLSSLAKKADLKCLVRHDSKEDHLGKASSTWVILARSDYYEKAFGSIMADVKESKSDDKKWYWIEKRGQFREDAMKDAKLWTDDSPNDILEIFMW